ncbi:Ulp1 family isopeptidase [Neoaquamicrobium sediminum]|uniref:Ulp1 family isopeptidase n=1 Tax=Neoaquamicrobium sediminum TaxID=1849104 RepID=UPI0040363C4C
MQGASVVLIPFNFTGHHWTLAAAYPSSNKVVYWDPFGVRTTDGQLQRMYNTNSKMLRLTHTCTCM